MLLKICINLKISSNNNHNKLSIIIIIKNNKKKQKIKSLNMKKKLKIQFSVINRINRIKLNKHLKKIIKIKQNNNNYMKIKT